ncbi:MAG: FG-GAP-like repeat-containing protein [bacterium]
MRNMSAGNISALQGLPFAGNFQTIAAGDFDCDGHMDIVAGSSVPSGHDVVIFYGEGNGTWDKIVKLPVYGAIHSISVGDINNDGLQDICISIWEKKEGIVIWVNKGNDIWQEIKAPTKSDLYDGVFLYDLNADRKMDILAANYSEEKGVGGGIHIWLGNSGGDWGHNVGPIANGRFTNVAVADFNLDDQLDIAGTSWGPNGQLMVWLGRKGMQNWAAMPALDSGNFWGIEAADLNNDYIIDLIASTYQDGIRIYYGDCTGLFSPPQILIDAGHFWDVLVYDLNEDGWLDILASSFDDKGIGIWSNAGKGQCIEWENKNGDMKISAREWESIDGLLPNFGSYYDMLLNDFDQDGHIDLAAASKGQGVKIWLDITNSDKIDQENAKLNTGSIEDESKEKALGTIENKKNRTGVNSPQDTLTKKMLKDKENQVYRMINGVPEYIIGPDDTVEITYWEGMDSKVYTVHVRPNGTISTPFFDDFKIGDLTASEADNLLTEKMKRFVHSPRIDIRVVDCKSKKATVLGSIARPGPNRGAGTYYLSGKTRILELIARAGGPGPEADLKSIEVIQKGVTQKVNLYKAIFYADLSQNIILDNNDVVFVPRISDNSSKVYVFGEVKSPGIYPFSGPLTLLDVIAKAGGYGKDARLDSVKVVRGDLSAPEVISCDLGGIIKKGDIVNNVDLLNNDVVYIPKSKIANLKLFVEKIDYLLRLVLYPVALVNTVEDPEELELRLDLGPYYQH